MDVVLLNVERVPFISTVTPSDHAHLPISAVGDQEVTTIEGLV